MRKPKKRIAYYVAAPGEVPTVTIRQQRTRVDPLYKPKDPNYISFETKGVAPCVATVTQSFMVYRSELQDETGVPEDILSIPVLPPNMVIAGEFTTPYVAESVARDLNALPVGYRRAS